MNASTNLVVCALVAASATSCVSKTADENSGSLESGESKTCERLTPCDSDVTGAWHIDHLCFFAQPTGKYFFEKCPEGKIEAVSDTARGDFTFDKNGNYTEHLEYVGRMLMTMPLSCLPAGKTCAVFEDEETSCETTRAACVCTVAIETGPASARGEGKYHRTGTTLDLEGDTAVNYCAKGDTLKLETRVGMPEMGADLTMTMQISLKRR